MDGTITWHCVFGVIRCPFFSRRKCHEYGGGPFRTVRSRQTVGYGADRCTYMIVAYVGGNRTFCKILSVYRVASGVIVADTGDCQLAGFTADLSGFYTVWHWKARIGQPFMDPGHDLPPYGLVEGGASVLLCQLLVVIAAGPDTSGIIRGVAYEPDIIVCGGGTAFTCS